MLFLKLYFLILFIIVIKCNQANATGNKNNRRILSAGKSTTIKQEYGYYNYIIH